MLKLVDQTSAISGTINRTVLTDCISYFNIQAIRDKLRFQSRELSVSLIFNYGQAIEIQVESRTRELQANQFNAITIAKEELLISSQLKESPLSLYMITLPFLYFKEIMDYFSLKPDGIEENDLFVFKDNNDISDQLHYNIQTINAVHSSPEGASLYAHGKLLTILGLQMQQSATEPAGLRDTQISGRLLNSVSHTSLLPKRKCEICL